MMQRRGQTHDFLQTAEDASSRISLAFNPHLQTSLDTTKIKVTHKSQFYIILKSHLGEDELKKGMRFKLNANYLSLYIGGK
jgi:hypothetical protein